MLKNPMKPELILDLISVIIIQLLCLMINMQWQHIFCLTERDLWFVVHLLMTLLNVTLYLVIQLMALPS